MVKILLRFDGVQFLLYLEKVTQGDKTKKPPFRWLLYCSERGARTLDLSIMSAAL